MSTAHNDLVARAKEITARERVVYWAANEAIADRHGTRQEGDAGGGAVVLPGLRTMAGRRQARRRIPNYRRRRQRVRRLRLGLRRPVCRPLPAFAQWIHGINRGVLLAPGLDEQWLISVMHSDSDAMRYAAVFDEFVQELTA